MNAPDPNSLPDYKSLSRGHSTDMSPIAIKRRLEIVDELYEMGKFLARAKVAGKAKDREPGVSDTAQD